MSTTISVRIPENIASKLSEIVKETKRPKSYHVQKALETYFAEYANLQVALNRLHDTSDSLISIEDIRSMYNEKSK